MNLSNNAAYAMRESGGILDVRLTRIEVDSDMAAKYPPLKARAPCQANRERHRMRHEPGSGGADF